MRKLTKTSMAVAMGMMLPGVAPAVGLVGLFDIGSGYSLGAFDSTTVSTTSFIPVTGIMAGEQLLGLDYRPTTGDFYVISAQANVYTVSLSTGLATGIGSYSGPVPGNTFGFDFNPAFMAGGFARIISDTDDNRVISGMDGSYLAPIEKTDVACAVGDVNQGANPAINHIAYTNSVFGATGTQQYGIDTDLNVLVTVANNAGTLATVGGLGVNASALGGFDIAGSTGEAFAALQNGPGSGISTLYSIDLTTGNASSLGLMSGDVIGLTAVPEPSSILMIGLAGLGMGLRRRR